MQTGTEKLVVLITKGIESELSSVAFTIANGGLTAGLKVSVFLTSTAIDLVRRGGQRLTQVAPLESLAALIEDFQKRGGTIWACPPCVKSRGYEACGPARRRRHRRGERNARRDQARGGDAELLTAHTTRAAAARLRAPSSAPVSNS